MRRVLLPALLAAPLAFGAQAASEFPRPSAAQSAHAPLERTRDMGGPVLLAQAGDPRVVGLEEQIRQLRGTVEELNFQVLQMQEQMRKMQEDNEFRFQQLEGRGSGGGGAVPAAGQRSDASGTPGSERKQPQAGTQTEGRLQPRTFGTITFDAQGNPTGGTVSQDATVGGAADGTTVAALPSSDDPEELYQNAYQFILSGDYKTAEAGFRGLIDRFPDHTRAADAHFWLGEALLGQDRYRDAAEIFLAASRDFPRSRKAPDILLKLGISLAAMKQRDVACATFAEVGTRFPDATQALKERVRQEQARAGC